MPKPESMAHCAKCASILLQRRIDTVEQEWAKKLVQQVRQVTRTLKVFQRICPTCDADKVGPFVNGEEVPLTDG